MPRRARATSPDSVYHVLNRASKRLTLFSEASDYSAFEAILFELVHDTGMRLLSYCIMPNHWHLVLWPKNISEMSDFMRRLTATHALRWHAFHKTGGTGPVYQGRYKAIPVQQDSHFFHLCRYVERNPLRAGLVLRAEDWTWSSLSRPTEKGSRPPFYLTARVSLEYSRALGLMTTFFRSLFSIWPACNALNGKGCTTSSTALTSFSGT